MNLNELIQFVQREELASRALIIDGTLKELLQIGILIAEKMQQGHKIGFCGNGGSATLASHLVAEFVSRYKKEKPSGLPAVSFNDVANITGISNDYGYEQVFTKQVEAYLVEGDILIGLSTSGNSENVVQAIECAKNKNILTIVFTGSKTNILQEKADFCLCADSEETAIIQSIHLIMGHLLCEIIDDLLF